MRRSFYYGLAVFIFYVVLSFAAVSSRDANPLLTSISITVMTFCWFKMSVNWEELFGTYRDVMANILIYSCITSFFAFVAIVFSGSAPTFVNLLLHVSTVGVWIIIWTDYYFLHMKGKWH